MGTRPQCLVNLMFFSLGDVGESAPSALGWTLTRLFCAIAACDYNPQKRRAPKHPPPGMRAIRRECRWAAPSGSWPPFSRR